MTKYIVISVYSAKELEEEADKALNSGYKVLRGVSVACIPHEYQPPIIVFSQP